MSTFESRMMNIAASAEHPGDPLAYKLGHRDARHAAAEIALEADAQIAALRAQLDVARGALAEFTGQGIRQHEI